MGDVLTELVATAREKTEAEREFDRLQRRLLAIDEERVALSRAGRRWRWFWQSDDGTTTTKKHDRSRRRELLDAEESALLESVADLRNRAAGAEVARVAVGKALSDAEAALLAVGGPTAAELRGLSADREREVVALRMGAEVLERIREAQGIVDRTSYLLQTEGVHRDFVTYTGQMQPQTLTQTIGEPGALVGEADLRGRLDVLSVAVQGRSIEAELRRVAGADAGPESLGGWLRDVAAVLGDAFRETVEREDRRELRLAEIDDRRIEILSAQ